MKVTAPLGFSLRQKILGALLGLLSLFGLAIVAFIKAESSTLLRLELQKRGISIAKHIAQNSIGGILARDPLTLKIAAHQQLKIEEDLAYIIFLGPEPGEVLAHTFGETFPVGLLEVNGIAPGQEYSIRKLSTELGPIHDIAVPISSGGLGQLRLGISAGHTEQAIAKLTREVLTIALTLLLVGAALALPLSAALARPIGRLTAAAEAIAEGNLEQQVPPGGSREIGQLASAFNTMAANLAKTRDELVQHNQTLSEEVQRRELAENRLASQLSFLSILMNEIPSPVYFKDTEGTYQGCNRAFEEFMARPRESVIGKRVFELLPENQAATHHRIDQDLFREPGIRVYEGSVIRGDGLARQIIFNKATFCNGSGQLAGLVGTMLDVTQEREATRLRNEFVSTAAHEFQTPLTAIIGFAELLHEHPAIEGEDTREYLSIIQNKAEFLSRLVDQLLDVSRLEAGRELPLDKKPSRLDHMARNLVRSYQQRFSRHRFKLVLTADCPEITVDPDRFAQVLENLLSNAVKYSPQGGEIRVSVEATTERLLVQVVDQGKGMTAEQLSRAFEKFYRSDTSDTAPSGTGLGLYIVKSIVEAHNGTLEAHSVVDQGTTISFSLPWQSPTEKAHPGSPAA